ncbi:MAG: DUF115 domain-containing protein [Desulfobulbaceae bacterium]|nr:DUF115 domain-containing protein [Desulfobulbaceae bacterium]
MQTSSNFYKNNLASLKKHQPEAWANITTHPPAPMGEIITNSEGLPNLAVTSDTGETILLHDKTDEYFALQIVPKDTHGTVVLFGMGLGYGALTIQQQRPKISNLIIFELYPGIFIQAMHCMDLTPLISDPRLSLSLGAEPDFWRILAPASLAMLLEFSYTLEHQASFSINQAAYQDLHDKAYEIINSYNVNGNTLLRSGEIFLNNTFNHLKSIHHNLFLDTSREAFKNIPAILVAGGPSLNKNIDQLSKAKGQALIIAVDAALPALLAHDIIPDIVGALDGSELAYEKIADLAPRAKEFLLTSVPTVCTKTPKTFRAKQVIWSFSHTPLDQRIDQCLNTNSLLESTGTVAHMNFLVAVSLGCSPIILVGQDLAFPIDGGKDHVKGAVLTKDFHPEDNKEKETICWVKGIKEDKVPTNRSFLFLKKHLEQLIAQHPNHYINATEGGADIKGTEILSLTKALKIYCSDPQDILNNIEAQFNKGGSTNTDKLVAWMEATLKDIKKMQQTITKTDKLTTATCKKLAHLQKEGKPFRSFDTLPINLQKQINKIDKGQEQSDHPMEIWNILSDVTGEGLRVSERLKQEILGLKDRPEKYLEYALKSLERILVTNSVRIIALEVLEKNLKETLDHHKTEIELLKAITKDNQNQSDIMNLARFYFEAGELVLAQPLLEKVYSTQPDSAEINFYLGCISAKQADHKKATAFFETTKSLNPDFKTSISDFQQQLGNQYFKYWQESDNPVMLSRGLKYAPDNPKIIAQKDLIKIAAAHKSTTPEQTDDLIRSWHKRLESDDNLANTLLTTAQVAEFYAHHGQLLMSEGKFQEATTSYLKALSFTPENPDYQILTTEAFFCIENFEKGIEHLKKAIKINPAYAKHWEEIGDQLQQTGQHQDAISAYEQCFHILPENIFLLKKIGECYQAMDNPNAALSVYQMLKDKIENKVEPQERNHNAPRQ